MAEIKTRLTMRAGAPFPARVLARADGREPALSDLNKHAALSAWLTHDPDMSWPDEAGVALMRAVLKKDGTVVLAFANLADALACQQRMARETVQ